MFICVNIWHPQKISSEQWLFSYQIFFFSNSVAGGLEFVFFFNFFFLLHFPLLFSPCSVSNLYPNLSLIERLFISKPNIFVVNGTCLVNYVKSIVNFTEIQKLDKQNSTLANSLSICSHYKDLILGNVLQKYQWCHYACIPSRVVLALHSEQNI